jgi:hypothetical protein
MSRRDLGVAAGLGLALLAPAGIAHAQDDGLLRLNVRSVERVEFAADISEEAVVRYARVLLPGEIVEIQSRGGDIAAALAMAEVNARLGARLRVLGGPGQCRNECALVWLAADDRTGPDFVPLFFDGGVLPWTEALALQPDIATPQEQTSIAHAAGGWDRLFAERGIAPWLHACAWRLRNVQLAAYPPEWPLQDDPVRDRVRIMADFDAVWFPKEVLQAAGVTGLDIFDPPSDAQRQRHSPLRGDGRPGRILWAEADACDVERAA